MSLETYKGETMTDDMLKTGFNLKESLRFKESKRLKEWNEFNKIMHLHLINYAEQQYDNLDGDEQIDLFTSEDYWQVIQRYYNRRNKNAHGPVEQLRDAIKVSHYAQQIYDKLKKELNMEDIYN